MFSSVPQSNSDNDPDQYSITLNVKGKQRELKPQPAIQPPLQTRPGTRPVPPGLPPYSYWYSPSQSSLDSPTSPSHIAWLNKNDSSSSATGSSAAVASPPTTAAAAAHVIRRSASSPPLSTTPTAASIFSAAQNGQNPGASVGRPKLSGTKSAHSLRLAPQDNPFHAPLSPIVEQDYFSPEKRPASLPTGDSTVTTSPSTIISPVSSHLPNRSHMQDELDAPRPSPIYSTFIGRPLNRSISQSSTRTLASTGSLAPLIPSLTPTSSVPPVIPPLDFRPQFPGPLPFRTATQGPRQDGVGTYDDASSVRAESFMTANSAADYNNRMSRLSDALRLSDDDYLPRPQPSHSRSHDQSYPLAYSSQDDRAIDSLDFQTNRYSVSTHSLRSVPRTPSVIDSDASISSSFIDRRFAPSLSIDSTQVFSPPVAKQGKEHSRSWPCLACVLFWTGFVAPWCWLIGGWLLDLSSSRQNSRHGQSRDRSILPMWTVPQKTTGTTMLGSQSKVAALRESLLKYPSAGMVYPFELGYPFVAPSAASLMPPSSKGKSSTPTHLGKKAQTSPTVRDQWILRCRAAAVVSGVLLTAAFIVALVVVGQNV